MDRALGTYRPADVIVISGDVGEGKTTLFIGREGVRDPALQGRGKT